MANRPQDAVVLLSVGTLRMQKRLRVILQAMARLRNREQLHYVICGEGPDMPFLQKLTRQLHLEERVHLLGYRTDIPDMLGAADIFCMPSRREGCGMAALGIGICRFLPGWLGADPSLQGNASAYFGIWSAALPFSMAMGMYSAMLRATGDALTPSLISVLVCVLDIFFNFFLINPTREMELFGQTVTMFGFGWGVPGAALGTALATLIGGLAALAVLLLRESPLAIRYPGSWKITRSCLINLWRVGVPLAAERAALSSAQVLLVRIVSQLGTVAIAANSLGVSAESLCYMAGYGIQDATLALVGQAVGANRRDMAKRFSWLCTGMGVGIMALTGVGMYIFAPQLMGIFTADAAVIALGAQVLRIEALAEPMFGASIVASGAMQGAGDSTGCFVLNLVSMWGIRLTLATLLAPHFGLVGVWVAMSFELTMRGVLFLVRLARGKWLDKGALA